ncbi:hypothetical protein N0V90_007911 [Kalmusia sp. IMI 367209]|nr:hypothetical protein N0V90_007911 [Kalmusia sp. IMI 367209]
MSGPIDFTNDDIATFYSDHLLSGTLLGAHSSNSPFWILKSNEGDEGITSLSLSSTVAKPTTNDSEERPGWGSLDPNPSHFGNGASVMEGSAAEVEERSCRLLRNLGCNTDDTSQASLAKAFEHTTALISIVGSLKNSDKRTGSTAETHNDNTEAMPPEFRLSNGFSSSEQTKSDDLDLAPSSDPSVVLLILSCYVRLTRLYQRLIELVLEKLENASPPGPTSARYRSGQIRALAAGTSAMG